MLARARLHKSLADGLDRRLKVSHRRTIVAEVRSAAAYYQSLRSVFVFCTTMERPGDPPVGLRCVHGSPFQIPQNCVPFAE